MEFKSPLLRSLDAWGRLLFETKIHAQIITAQHNFLCTKKHAVNFVGMRNHLMFSAQHTNISKK
jgi:hypothetical protein